MLVHHFLERAAQTYPHKQAVWYQNNWMTYREIDERSNAIGNALRTHGVQRGDRVALLFENSFNYITGYYGILKAGAVTVALNPENKAESLAYLLKDCGARAIIISPRRLDRLLTVLDELDDLKLIISDKHPDDGTQRACVFETLYSQGDKSTPDICSIDMDLASIVYTSGSTGRPKGAMLTHLNIVSNTRSIVSYLHLTANDRIMTVLPFYYIYGKSLLNTHFYVGGSLVIDNRFAYPNAVLKTMTDTDATGFAGVPSTFMILLHRSNVRSSQFKSLRYITQAGGAMAPSVQKDVMQVFAPAKLYVMYGATEASARLAYLEPEKLNEKLGSIGKAIPNVELFVADQNGQELPVNTTGELVARGSNIMAGYWNDPEETAQVLKHGLYFTGDLGQMDEDGYLYVVGRKKDMIKVGGERVSAREIEEALLEIDGIVETAVIGVDDDILGEAIKAFVVVKNGINDAAIRDSLIARLPAYKLPKSIEIVDSLPKNESGKILKQALKKTSNETIK